MWLGIGVFFIIAELFATGFIIVFFGIGALIAGVTAFGGVSLPLQVVIFGISSLALLFLLRKTMATTFAGNFPDDEKRTDLAINTLCEVTIPINPPKTGRIKYQGSFWTARCSEPVATGVLVRIICRDEKNPNVFMVEKEN